MSILKKFRSIRRRTRLIMIATLLLVIWMLWPDQDDRLSLHPPNKIASTAQPCIELRPDVGPYQEGVIWEPGYYCVATDFWQLRLYGGGHSGPAPYRHLVAVKNNDVTVDLANHILHSDGHSSGVVVSVINRKKPTNPSKLQAEVVARNITIKNGVIDLRGLGTAVTSTRKWSMYRIDEAVPENLTGYEKSNITLENLLIKTDNIGIILEGDGNVIRNCVIESGGNGTIMFAGPNGKIVNNTIILNNPFFPASMAGVAGIEPRHFSEFIEEKKAPQAAIALHHASGTLISGNRIEVKGKSATRHNIYIANDSKDVRIEGNTFVGADDSVTLVGGSTAELKNNLFEKKKASWWEF